MSAFFATQLDFIFFFYGLAFILLGSICLGIARAAGGETPWRVLAAFAFIHGGSEWLDLLSLIIRDTPAFAASRTGVMTLSFVLLFEFPRLEGIRLGLKLPGRWIYVPLLLLVAYGAYLSGLDGANAFARYVLGFTGAGATAAVLALRVKEASSSEKRWIIVSALGFALYAIAAGAIVPPTANWAGDVVNYDDFSRLTGMPIQFVRGLLACWIAFSIWGYWNQHLMREVGSRRYSKFMKRQFVSTLAAMSTILVLGWVLTEYLGGIYKQNVQHQAVGDLDLIAGRLSGETAVIDGMVRVLAASRAVGELLIERDKRHRPRVNSVLRLDSEVSDASAGYIVDRTGAAVATYGDAATVDDGNFTAAPYFKSALAGQSGHHFVVGSQGKTRDYYASQPVRNEAGDIVGAAILKKSLDGFDAALKGFDVSFFLIDPHGIVVVTNQPESQFRTLWPLAPETVKAIMPQLGPINTTPLLKKEFIGANWGTIGGTRDYAQRRAIDHSDWSLVTVTAPQGIFASRVLGIIITLQMATLALVYLVGRERWIHDTVQLQKRVELEELARNLDFSAATDPLTGLYNRRKLDRELAMEILRSQRYKTPLSLTLFDIDHFKAINDTHGHQVGDDVLIELSGFVGGRIRQTDILARWGGEEFVILMPGCTADMGCNLATNLAREIRSHVIDNVNMVTCSFGVAEFEDNDTAETLIARADEALYRAKLNGRDRVELASRRMVTAPDLAPMT